MSSRLRAMALAFAVVACGQSRESPALAEQARVELAPASSDVWAPDVRVTVTPALQPPVAGCELVGPGVVPLTRARAGYGALVALEPGNNRYFARCRDATGRAIESEPVVYRRTTAEAPRAHLAVRSSGAKLVLDGSASAPAERSRAALTRFWWTLTPSMGGRAERVGDAAVLEVRPPPGDGEYLYALSVEDAQGSSDVARILVRVRDGRFELPNEASWARGAVVYGVIPPLFGRDRPLEAVREALPSLAGLGVTALWLSPVFAAARGDFGYAVTDHFAVRSDFGMASDLRALVEEAHRHELRVLLDFVPNHTASEHPYFRQTEELGRRSHYYGYYERDRAGRALHYFDWEHLPNLEFANSEVSRWITLGALFWLENAGVDGYRVDAAWGIREREPAFYPTFLRELRRLRPDVFVLAEASARDGFYFGSGFDAAYDWTDELGKWAWEGVFDAPTGIAQRLAAALAETDRRAARKDRVFRFLNNNDTGERFITRHGLELTRVATVLLLTLPGIPCIYTFDEVGGEFEPYAELPPSDFRHPELREFHQRLIALRRAHPALHGPEMHVLPADPSSEVFAYIRHSPDGPPALVLLNFGARPANVSLRLPDGMALPRSLRRVFESSTERLARGTLRAELPAFGYAVFVSD